MKRWLIITVTFVALLVGLEVLQHRHDPSEKRMPFPSSVARYIAGAFTDGNEKTDTKKTAGSAAATTGREKGFFEKTFTAVSESTLLSATEVTLKRLAFGYLIGVILGIPLGLISARFNFIRETLGIVALGMQGLPSVCWVPLSLIWFGPTEEAILFVVVMGTVWSLMLATESGVRTVPPLYIRAANTMGSKGLHLWAKVLIPASLPTVMGGMKQSWAFAWRSLMAAEIYVTILSGYGLGWLLHNGRETLNMAQVLGVMLIIVAVGLIVDRVIFSPGEEWVRSRWGLNRK